MTQNIFLKILVLLIAIILWIQQMLLKIHSETIELPIILENVPEKLIAIDDEKPFVNVTLEGNGIDIFLFITSKEELDDKIAYILYDISISIWVFQ